MLTAYFDESGWEKTGRLCIVAGFMGNESQWLPFVNEWIPALGQRKNLHMKELRWNQKAKQVKNLLAALGQISYRHRLIPVVGGMWHKDYNDLVKSRIRDAFATPYMFAMQACIVQTLRFISSQESIQFLFEEQRKFEWAAQILHDSVFKMRDYDPRVRGIEFRKKASTVCLDPSDYLAFQVREYKLDPNSRKAQLGMSILGSGDVVGHIWTRDEISKMVDDFVAKGVLLPEGKL